MERTISLSQAKTKLNSLVKSVGSRDDEFMITKNGKPVAALVPVSLYEGWRETEEIKADREFVNEIKKGVNRLKRKGKRYTFEDVFGEKI